MNKLLLYGLIGVGVLVILFFAAVYLFSDKQSMGSCASKNLKVAAFGDSLVAGYGATPGNDLPSLLSKEVGVPVQNFGVSGNTTADALARISDVTDAHPDVVIVLLGGNDALQRTPQTITEKNLSYIISTLQASHIKVVLVGVLGGFPSDPYAKMFASLAKTFTPIRYVPNILSGLIGNTQYMSDEIHPNDAGYAKVAERLAPAVEDACSL